MTYLIQTPTLRRTIHSPATRPGAVAGTVLRLARRSATIKPGTLAAGLAVTQNTLASWESGTYPLACLPAPDIGRLQQVLTSCGADLQLVRDLDAAIWCDLVLAAVSRIDDLTCLLADPITIEPAFRALLTWSITGIAPVRYRPYLPPAPRISRSLAERARRAITTIHPELATACIPPGPARPAWQPESRHRYSTRSRQVTRPCAAGQSRQPDHRIRSTCYRPGHRARQVR